MIKKELLKRMNHLFFVLLLLVIQVDSVRSQQQIIIFSNSEKLPKKIKNVCKPKRYNSPKEVKSALQEVWLNCVEMGYYLTNIAIQDNKDTVFASITLGEKMEEIEVEIPEMRYSELRAYNVSLNSPLSNRQFFRPAALSHFCTKVLHAYLNNGYPFASVGFKKVDLSGTSISLEMDISPGTYYEWKQIIVKGDSSLSVNIASSLTGIKRGDAYSEEDFNFCAQRLSQVNYIKSLRKPEVLFEKDGVILYLYLQGQKISSVQGALGLQPNPLTQKVGLTGDFQMKLVNVLKKAEQFDLSWRSIQPQTQSLTVKFVYPYLFRSPFGTDVRFNLYKRDSTFLDVKSNIGVTYALNGGSILKASYQLTASSLLGGSGNSTQFSRLSNVKTNAYAVSYYKRKLDYIPNPSKGTFVQVEFSIGTRNTVKDSLREKSSVWRLGIQWDRYFSLAARHVLKLATSFETYHAPVIYQNELYRFGGLNSLRGFNEDELYASTKAQLTLEYRFLVDKNSNAFLFYDQAMYENNAVNYYKDHPFSVGTGFSFGTRLGIFTISYAVGKQFNNPFDFRLSKIHFGYTAYF